MTTTHRNALNIGTRIDRYEIEAIIGHGGFGISYRAVDTEIGERVAIKEFLPTELATREADDSIYPLSESHLDDFQWGLERFLDEVNLLARFRHPSIVRVYRAFEGNGTAYMVMAFEEGESLSARLKREGTLASDVLVATVMPLLDGLELVHEAGFIHRDIKPSNIYLRDDGGPVLLDFGSAREALRGKTRTLTALVSAGYAPLEQYFSRSDLQGPWTDIYGLGATLYEAISGAPPIDAVERSRGVLGSTRDILPPAAEVAARDYPPYLLAAVDHALRMEDQDRPRSIPEWRSELTGETPVPERPETTLAKPETRVPTVAAQRTGAGAARPLRDRPGLFSLVAVLLLATASLMWWQWSGVNEAIDNRIADPQPRAAEDLADSRLDALRETLAEANASADLSQKQIATLTARLSELEAVRDAERSDDVVQQPTTEVEQTRFREQDAIIAELRGALEAANRDGNEARRQADEFATRLNLLEAVQTTDDTEFANRRKEIDGLLAAADDDLRRLRLTTPAGANAHERYRRVLELDDSNADARLGLEYVVEKYIELAARARDRGDAAGAAQYLDRASGVLPEHADLVSARNDLAKAESEQQPTQLTTPEQEPMEDRTRAETRPVAAPTDASAHSPSPDTPLRVAILPNEWASGTHAPHTGPGDVYAASLADDIIDSFVATSEFKIGFDFRNGGGYYGIPDSTELWKGNAVDRVPDTDAIYRIGEQIGVDAILMWQARFVAGFASFPVAIHLFDIDNRRKFHFEGKSQNVAEAVDTIVAQYLDAANIATTPRDPAPTFERTTAGVSNQPAPASRTTTSAAADPGSQSPGAPLSLAILPQLWTVGTNSPHIYNYTTDVGDEIVDRLAGKGNFRIMFDFREGAGNSEVPDSTVIWKGNAVKKVPDTDAIYRIGERLGINTVVMWWARPVQGFESWPVTVHLIDIQHRREFHTDGTNRNVIAIVDSVVGQYMEAANIVAGGAKSAEKVSPSPAYPVSATKSLKGPAKVAILPFVRRRYSIIPFHEIVSRELATEIINDGRLRLAYSFYAEPGRRRNWHSAGQSNRLQSGKSP